MSESKQFYINVGDQRVAVTKEVYLAYYRSMRRERYFERDLKTESTIRDKDGNITGYRPAKEDSLDRLMATGEDYADKNESIEDAVFSAVMADRLHEALGLLSEDEQKLIDALFFQELSERQAAVMFGITQKAINKRKVKILSKLKTILKT